MKNISNKIILSLSFIFLFLATGLKQVQAQNDQVSFQLFYDELSPYGQWIDDSQYGYIWIPDVRGDFRPYATNGHWINTEYGNTWYSDYDWGWAPFHYGNWVYNNNYGWAWVPGYEWGPAWVSWRQGGGQYGWAPLGPGVSFGISINIPLSHWIFVPQRYFFSPRIYSYYTPFNRYNSFYNRTTIINNVYVYNNRNYYGGPGRNDLARVTRTPVRVYNVNNSNRPGRATIDSRSVSIYRPQINQATRTTSRPSRVANTSDIRNERPTAVAPRSSNRPNATNNTGRPAATRPEQGRATTVRGNSGNSNNNQGSSATARPTTQRPVRSTAPVQRQNNNNNNTQGRATAPARQTTARNSSATQQSRATTQRSTPARQATQAARPSVTRVTSSSPSKGSSAAASGRSAQPSQSRARSDRNSR
ncbi:DUF6600 domain-containing protein [Albibacterium bauzanense]|uniref:YXWGXW repeat-containing protein n=1 Tax=Albibacterium bauzanense TaxID=653929 RepID=A0A4R1LQV5_9SPHI|nr:DUF6600 domain-containing protein [Albibacterium bauzanense]TCK80694.1 hypothetical protein C8N28_2440 [Albibacterium bauzanense]